jgi:hypothetical protein
MDVTLFSLASFETYSCIYTLHLRTFVHSTAMCRMWRFLAVLRIIVPPPCYIIFPPTLLHQLFFHPPSLHLTIYFLVCFSVLFFPNSYIIMFWEFYFLPLSVHVQTNIIYLTLSICALYIHSAASYPGCPGGVLTHCGPVFFPLYLSQIINSK